MSIITETFYIKNREFIRTYSDQNRYVVREGQSYSEACDPAEFYRTYTEGDLIPNEIIEPDSQEDIYSTVGKILMGVQE